MGALAAGGAVAFLGLSLLGRPRGDGGGTLAGTFTLRAYAEGIPQGNNTVLAQKSVGMGGSIGGAVGYGWYVAHDIDLTCQGTGVRSVSYCIEGDHVSETGQPPEDSITCAVYLDALYNRANEAAEGEPYPDDGGTPTGFTVSYDGQQADEKDFNRQVWTAFPDDAEIAACYAALDQTGDAASTYEEALAASQAHNDWRFLLERRSSELLAQTTLVMEATFEDGSLQAKRYVIAPIADFDEVLRGYLDELSEAEAQLRLYDGTEPKPEGYEKASARAQELYGTWPDLYTITELEG